MFCAWCSGLLLLLQGVAVAASNSWPVGLYGLLKPITGCPTGWADNGWFFQDTEDTNPRNNRSETLHIEGFVVPSNVLRYFCVKRATFTSNSANSSWPKGQYCIYRRSGQTVTGMQRGWIRMYDEYTRNKDTTAFTGDIIRINYWHKRYWYTDFYFSCQTSGNKKIPIALPITKPFYLLPYGSRDCQQVKWMVATTEWIKYHTRNYERYRYDQKGGKVPHHELGNLNNKGITMYYCYYQSCNYTLTETEGVFQSPGFPGKYPDGQLCSWRIMVPANHVILVHFTNFSLYGNDGKDNLTLYTNVSGVFESNATFYGNRRPFTIKSTSDLLFTFLTNNQGNSSGFRAEYIIFLPKALAPQITTKNPKPVTSSSIPTKTLTTMASRNQSSNGTYHDTFKNLPASECDGTRTTIAVVIPLICLTFVVVIAVVIFYRWRSKDPKCKKCKERFINENAFNPTYEDGISQRTSTATMNTTMGADDNEGRMYKSLSRDQQPEYESPDYSKQKGTADPYMDPGCPEYHELEPMDNNVPDVVYNVLEGPDPNNGPSDDQTYQALDQQTTHNPLYQSANPATMVTHNRLYVDSVA